MTTPLCSFSTVLCEDIFDWRDQRQGGWLAMHDIQASLYYRVAEQYRGAVHNRINTAMAFEVIPDVDYIIEVPNMVGIRRP